MASEPQEVSRHDAIRFLERAARNWSHVPQLSSDDIADVARALSSFLQKHRQASEQSAALRGAERMREALKRLERAASSYGMEYLLDEHEDPELCGIDDRQHAMIVELADAAREARSAIQEGGEHG